MSEYFSDATTSSKSKIKLAIAGGASALLLTAFGAFAFVVKPPASPNVVSDDFTVEHVPDRISSKLATASSGITSLSDTGYRVRTRTLVADASKVVDDATIEDVYSGSDEEIVDRLVFQSESLVTVYDFGDANDYVAYLDVSGDDGKTEHPQDAVFAYDTTQGEMIDVARYDRETGIAYIPKSFFAEDRLNDLSGNQSELQAQTLVRYDLGKVSSAYEQDKNADVTGTDGAFGELSSASKIPITVETASGSASKMAQVPQVGNQFALKLVDEQNAGDVDMSDVTVDINDGAITLSGSDDGYLEGSNMPSLSYDTETGDLNVHNVSPMQIMNVTAKVDSDAEPSMSAFAALATAGEIKDPTDKAYTVGHYGVANASGWTDMGYDATTKTIRRFGPGQTVQSLSDITIADLSDDSCAYVIAIGSCPKALGSSWSANGGTRWKADCIHASYPNGTDDPPSGGYYKVLAADWNKQTVTIAFFITCNDSGQEGAIVLTFSAPRNGTFTVHKKANANPALGANVKSSVPGAVFGVYSSRSAAQAGGTSGLVKKLTTDGKGKAEGSFEKGKYYVRELSVPWPYIKSDEIVSFSAKPRSKDKETIYNDSVPPIQIRKYVLPSAGSIAESDIANGNDVLLHAQTTVLPDGKSVTTKLVAKSDVSNVSVSNAFPSVLDNPVSGDAKFNAATGKIAQLKAGESVTVSQSMKTGVGWSNKSKLASICTIQVGNVRSSVSLSLHSASLKGTRYGIYSDKACAHKVGETELDSNGIGYYGKKEGERLSSNTMYYVREIAGANGYTVSSNVYPVTTSRNSQVSVSVADSFSTLILTKRNSAGNLVSDKFPQFKVTGAKYGVFDDRSAAEQRDESRVVKTTDDKKAIMTTDRDGRATTVSLGAGRYYVAELPSKITCQWNGTSSPGYGEPSNIESAIAAHDYKSKPNGKFLLDEQIHEVNLQAGKTFTITSNENVPVKIQLSKQSLRADLAGLSQFSVEGAVFGVYATEAAAKSAPVSANYGKQGDNVSLGNAVALLYGGKNGMTTVSGELPLQDYWVKEIRAPRNYKVTGNSIWTLNGLSSSGEVLHIKASDFVSSGKFIDGMIASPSIVKSNQPDDVTVQVHKDASEVPDSMKNSGNAMSLAGARFAVYKTYDDARDDKNRLSFRTDDQAAADVSKTDLLTTDASGWTNKAIGLPAEANYWVREIEPPHVISSDPEQDKKNIAESMYILNEEPAKATFTDVLSVDMLANQDEQVKPVSINISKYSMSIDPQGRNLHVGEKDANGIPYNDAYTGSAFEGAVFGLFDTREAAANAKVTDDVNDLSVEQAAWDAGAIAVMTSDAEGVCGTVDNLRWKPDGYYLRELKAPNSGCYKRNTEVLLVSCDRNTLDSPHIRLNIDEDKISRYFEIDEMPNYYYVKIEKTSRDPSVLSNTVAYNLEGIHFGIYKTYEEAQAATEENPGAPMYNLYTRKVTHDDGSVHYEATTGLTGPGVFWAKELIAADAPSNGFERLTAPIRVEAKIGGVPKYDTTPITPENSAPVFDASGKLQYKTAHDIDREMGIVQKAKATSVAGILNLNDPVGSVNSLSNDTSIAFDSIQLRNEDDEDENDEDGDQENTIAVAGNYNELSDEMLTNFATGDMTAFASYKAQYIHKDHSTASLVTLKRTYGADAANYSDKETDKKTGLTTNQSWTSTPVRYTLGNRGMYGATEGATSFISFFFGDITPNTSCTVKQVWVHVDSGYYIYAWNINGKNYTQPRWAEKVPGVPMKAYPVIKPKKFTVKFNANGGSGANADITATYDATPKNVSVPTRKGYTFRGYFSTATGGTRYYDSTGAATRTWNRNPDSGESTLYAHWKANTYKITLDKNDGSGTKTSANVTYDSKWPSVTPPTLAGYIFQGYYTTASGGTQRYKANGACNVTADWTSTSNLTLYAHWTPITYKVRFTSSDPNASLSPGMSGSAVDINCSYGTTYKTQGVLFHKFGHAMTGWKCGSTTYAPNANFSNLTTTNGATVTMTAVWGEKKYNVKYNDGLSAQFGPAPVVAAGWMSGYQCPLWFDDYAGDGQTTDTLEPVHYSHPYFAFKYWTDQPNGVGNRYANGQAVYNLAQPGQTKQLYGVWTPSFDYGVDCEPNIIPNQPLGGITVQKTVSGNSTAISDLSGITFQLFSDASCTQLVSTSNTDKNGIAFFTGLTAGKSYYIKENAIPASLSGFMEKSDDILEASPGQSASYTFENPGRQLSLEIVKRPSQDTVDAVDPKILSAFPPLNAKFAVYSTEQDARADVNRLSFTDKSGRQTTIATVTNASDDNGVPIASTTISGLPMQGLWLAELAAPSTSGYGYAPIKDPVFVDVGSSEVTDNGTIRVEVPNDLEVTSEIALNKTIDRADLANLPEALHGEAQSLTDGITYALYSDKASAAKRDDAYLRLIEFTGGTATVENLPHGTYYLIEWSLPDSAQAAGISRSDKIVTLEVGDGEETSETELVDSVTTRKMHVKKTDAETGEPITGVIFDIYSDDTKTELLCSTSQTDVQGIAVSSSDLIPGRSYFVQERYDSMPAEYNGNGVGTDTSWSGWVELELDAVDDAFVVENAKNGEKGSIEIRKTSNTGADISGVVFAVYDSVGTLYAEMEVVAGGTARLDDVPVGAYTVQEIVASSLHAITPDGSDAPVFEGTVLPGGTWSVNDGNPIVNYQGYVKVHKESSAPELSKAMPDMYSLEGAVYSLYPIVDGEPSADPLAVTMTTDADGNTEAVAVPLGSYKVVETTEPENFSTPDDQKEFHIDVTAENVTVDSAYVVESRDAPTAEPLANFTVEKRSTETSEASDGSPQGATSMENTKFAIEYSPNQADDYAGALASEKTRRWVIATDADGRATFDEESVIKEESDELYHDLNGMAALPVGTIVVREIVPPTGYTIGKAPTAAYRFNGQTRKFEEMFPDTDEVREWDGNPTFTAANDIYRADISFHKVDAYDKNKVMAHIPFALTLLDENGEPMERHLVATDGNGDFSSARGTLTPVNDNDQWIPGDVAGGSVDSAFAPNDSRVWFTGTNADISPSSDKGALIYGDYELREYRKDDTQHYQSLEPIYFSVRGNNDKSWIEIDGKKVEDGNLTEAIGDIENHSIHVTSTEFLDVQTKTHVMGDGSLSATETVSYADATKGESYIFETYAYDMDTKAPIEKSFEDIDGTMVTVQAGGSYVLVAAGDTGTVSIGVPFDGYDVAGRKVGLVTKVYHDGYLSDEHNANLMDEAESVSFAEIGTTAMDVDTSQHIGFSDGHVEITDVVTYENLVPGYEYVVNGTLMDKVTGDKLTDANGNVITSSTTFAPPERNGSVEMRFSFDKPSNEAFTTVAFEEISVAGEVVATHEDLDDEEQSVYYPSVQTVARDKTTGIFSGNAESGKISVLDTISYENLVPGKSYQVRGHLYTLDWNGNKSIIEGTNASADFTPVDASGKVEMAFECDAALVRGHRVLVGEEIWSEDKIIARHDDSSFSNQVVSYPSVSTEAFDVASGGHIGNGESDTDVVDVVSLKGLKPGTEYRIDGTIMARDANGVVTNTGVTAAKTFTAATESEEHRLSFDVPVAFLSRDIVVYERLSSHDGTHLLATHEQANDESQSIHYPKIGTVAISPNGGTHVGSNIDNKVIDTVAYDNLVPGLSYEVVGMLVDKGTGKFVTVPGSDSPIVSSTRFTPESPSGTVEVPFAVEGVDVAGKTLVVFEQLFVEPGEDIPAPDKTLVATHCDIDDEYQSVFYPKLRTSAHDQLTGTHVGSSVAGGTITDTVTYENLVPGLEYELRATLMDKDSGSVVMIGEGDDGHAVSARLSFVPDSPNGSINVTFEALAPEAVRDRTFVAYEKLFLVGFEMAKHEDMDDEEQSVSYPGIATSARDAETLLHEGCISRDDGADGGFVTVVDTVRYSHLVPGRQYKVTGKLVDKYEHADDEETLDDGKPASVEWAAVTEGETTFVPENASGSVEMEFKVERDKAYGNVLVAFEKLHDEGGNEIARHEDIDDEEQTVSYPKIGTVARDSKTGTRAGSNDEVDIVDAVAYEGLLEGHGYVVHGTLMDKATGQPVKDASGNAVTGETSFVANEHGTGEVEVAFSAQLPKDQLEGRTFVAFEKLTEAPKGDADAPGESGNNDDKESTTVVATHEDLDDEEQSIHYPRIRTFAENAAGNKMIPFVQNATIIDTVTYENLVPGIEYAIEGVMMNKQQNRELMAGGVPVTAKTTFVADKPEGEADVRFVFDGTDTEPCIGVAFETMKVNGATVAEHRDIDDADQTVTVIGVADELRGNETPLALPWNALVSAAGDGFGLMVLASMASCLAIIGGVAYRRRRMR